MKVLIVLILIAFAGCNPAKRLLKEHRDFEQIGSEWAKLHPCANDSTFIFSEGRIDSFYVPVPVTDTAGLRLVIDSVKKAIALKYIANKTDCNSQVNEAFTTGYQRAWYLCGKIKIPIKEPDTIKAAVVDRRTEKALSNQTQDLSAVLASEKDISAKYLKQRNIAYITIGIAVLLIILLSILAIKKI